MVAGALILLDIDYTAFNTSAGWLNFWLGADDNGTYETILSRKAPQRMWRPVMPANDAPTVNQHIGMGFFQIDHAPAGGGKTRRYVGHTGDQKAFTVFVYADPATNAAAIFASRSGPSGISISRFAPAPIMSVVSVRIMRACGPLLAVRCQLGAACLIFA